MVEGTISGHHGGLLCQFHIYMMFKLQKSKPVEYGGSIHSVMMAIKYISLQAGKNDFAN